MNSAFYRSSSDSAPGTPGARIKFNIPLLLSALGLMVADLTVFFSQQVRLNGSPLFTVVLYIVLIVSALNVLYQLWSQLTSGWHHQQRMTGFCATALLASFLLGLFSFVNANTNQSFPLNAFGPAISVLSLLCLMLLLVMHSADASDSEPQQGYTSTEGQALQSQIQNLQRELAQAHYQIQTLQALLPGEVPLDVARVPLQPAQVFPDDPQSYTPVPKRARFFTISKTNDPRVIYNEDICVISPNENFFALCDGAGGSELPRSWGFFLGQQWLRQPLYYNEEGITEELLSQWLNDPRQNWAYWVAHSWRREKNTRNQQDNKPPIANAAINKILRKGAAATLLGLRIDNYHWYATALGDTCLFQIDGEGQILSSMPLTHSSQFTQTPPLLSSRVDSNPGILLPSIRFSSSSYRPNEILLMATDALSRWILLQQERRSTSWQQLLNIGDQEEFESLIIELRQQEQIEEDDTTLVIIRL